MDPDTGSFINQDSYLGKAVIPPSLHRYLYAFGNPIVYVDLDGYATVKQISDMLTASIHDFQSRSTRRAKTALGNTGELHLEKILKKSGHVIIKGPASTGGAHNADLIAYDPESKQLTFIDNKVQTIASTVSKAANLDTEKGRRTSIEVARNNLANMDLPDDQRREIKKQLDKIENKPMKNGNWIVTNSLPGAMKKNNKVINNMVKRISVRMAKTGVRFADVDKKGKIKIRSLDKSIDGVRGSKKFLVGLGTGLAAAIPVAGNAATAADATFRLNREMDEDSYYERFMNVLGISNPSSKYDSSRREAAIISGEISAGEAGGWGGAAAGLNCGPWAVICSPAGAIIGGFGGDAAGGWAAGKVYDWSNNNSESEQMEVRKNIVQQMDQQRPKITTEVKDGSQ